MVFYITLIKTSLNIYATISTGILRMGSQFYYSVFIKYFGYFSLLISTRKHTGMTA
jgi:hypothetical protein